MRFVLARAPRFAVVLWTASGCYADADRFNEDYVAVYCDRVDRCDPEAFERAYPEGDAQCRELKSDVQARVLDGCEYDPEAARECIIAAGTSECRAGLEPVICLSVYRQCVFTP